MAQDWEAIRRDARSGDRAPEWPENVKMVSMKGIGLLGVDDQHRMYWDGHPVEIRRRLDLTGGQTLFAWATLVAVVIGALGTVTQGVDAGFDFGCKLHWWSENCPTR
jgi:hypothetical protein